MAETSFALQRSATLRKLTPRKEPYWGPPLMQGRYVGYRKIDAERGTWVARHYAAATGQKYQSLGPASPEFGYDEAKAAAAAWFDTLASGSGARVTVGDACRDYVANRLTHLGFDASYAIDMMFKRSVYSHPIAKVYIDALTFKTLEAWRDGLRSGRGRGTRAVRSISSRTSNRNLGTLKAALNRAATVNKLDANIRAVWDTMPMMTAKDGEGRGHRDVFLDVKQRRAFLAAITDPAFLKLAKAAMHTGARVGELTQATVAMFDARTGTLDLRKGKTARTTGGRLIPLSKDARAFFAACAKDRDPDALLLPKANDARWYSSDYAPLVRIAVGIAKLPPKTVFYTLRHSWITQALLDGMRTLDVSKIAGTSLAMIDKYYGQLVVGDVQKRLDSVQAL